MNERVQHGLPLQAGPGADSSDVVEYELTAEELVRYFTFAGSRSQSMQALRRRTYLKMAWGWFQMSLAMGVVISLTEISRGCPRPWAPVVVTLGGWALLLLETVLPAERRRRELRQYRFLANHPQYARLLQPKRLQLLPATLVAISAGTQSYTRWEEFTDVMATEGELYMIMPPDLGYIIPRRAFSNDEAYWALARLAQRYHEAASPTMARAAPA